jgi:type III secretory pathway component EscR
MYKTRKKEHLENITRSLSTYSDSIRQMATLSPQAMEKGFERYLAFLTKHHDAKQVAILHRVRRHYDSYRKNKRVDADMWKRSILE